MVVRNDIKTEDLVKMYDSGMSLREIGDKVGMKNTSVGYRLKQSGITLRSNKDGQKIAVSKGRYNKGLKGKDNSNWKGGKHYTKSGYIKIYQPTHPRSIGGYIWEHQFVWENANEMYLPDGWVIHHMNGIKDDNRPENLKAVSRKEHIQLGNLYIERIRELEEEIKLLKSRI